MTEKYPYPEREHIDLPKTPQEVLESLLAPSFTSSEMRGEVMYLKTLYDGRPFLTSARYYANLTRLAIIHNGPSPEDNTLQTEQAFFTGATVAIHADLYPVSKPKRDWVLGNHPLSGIDNAHAPEAFRAQKVRSMCEEMHLWRTKDGERAYLKLDDDTKMTLVEYAFALFGDLDSKEHNASDFISGYLFIDEVIQDHFEAYKTHGFLAPVP